MHACNPSRACSRAIKPQPPGTHRSRGKCDVMEKLTVSKFKRHTVLDPTHIWSILALPASRAGLVLNTLIALVGAKGGLSSAAAAADSWSGCLILLDVNPKAPAQKIMYYKCLLAVLVSVMFSAVYEFAREISSSIPACVALTHTLDDASTRAFCYCRLLSLLAPRQQAEQQVCSCVLRAVANAPSSLLSGDRCCLV